MCDAEWETLIGRSDRQEQVRDDLERELVAEARASHRRTDADGAQMFSTALEMRAPREDMRGALERELVGEAVASDRPEDADGVQMFSTGIEMPIRR